MYGYLASGDLHPPQMGTEHSGPKTLRHNFGGSKLSGHFGNGAEVSFRHFGPKWRRVLPGGPKCPDSRSEVSRPIL